MATVAVLNMKGGVGKTTLVRNLASHFAHDYDLWVLVVDLDPQFNLSQYMMGEKDYQRLIVDGGGPTIIDVFERDRPRLGPPVESKLGSRSPIYTIQDWGDRGGIHLIPSHLEFAWTLRNSAGKERLLRNYLAKLRNRYNLILIDCPPTESMATHAAYLSSNYILVPIKPEFLATIGLPLLATSLHSFHETNEDHKVDMAGIVFNDVADSWENARAKDDVVAAAQKYGWYIFQNEISHSQSYPKGARLQKSIFDTEYARYDRKQEFADFSAELLSRIALTPIRILA
jgi:chromosome partitioning protein